MTTIESDLIEAVRSALLVGARLELEHLADLGEWGVWLHSDDPAGDSELLGTGEARSEALEAALRTVRRWAE